MNGKTTIVSKAVNTATSKGITVFNSAGNEGNNSWGKIIAPADAFDIISVGSVGKNNIISSFSSRGPTSDGRIKPELVTLGEYVYGALAGMDTVYYSQFGTSAATPIAAGIGALTLSAYPFLTNMQLRNILLQSAELYPHANNTTGYGRLSAYRAITFPVIKHTAGETSVMKVALDSNARDYSMSISRGDGMYVQVPLLKRGNINEFAIAAAYANNRADFYFTYLDSMGAIKREPGNGLYYTNDWVTVNIVRQTTDGEFVTHWYPNPFHYKVFADISMAAAGNVEVKIYSITGELVFSRSAYMAIPGMYLFTWDGTNFSGNPVSSGVYICGVEASGKTEYKKIIRLR
ncbi:MAG: S8 family serine peptidase [Ignavibacteriales bacterium]|nr:S8 family serine peptidase [Ignavibacteriales bacterium]